MLIEYIVREGTATAAGGNIGAAVPSTPGARYEIDKIDIINQTDAHATITLQEDPTAGSNKWLTALDMLIPENGMIENIGTNRIVTAGSSFYAQASADDTVFISIVLREITT